MPKLARDVVVLDGKIVDPVVSNLASWDALPAAGFLNPGPKSDGGIRKRQPGVGALSKFSLNDFNDQLTLKRNRSRSLQNSISEETRFMRDTILTGSLGLSLGDEPRGARKTLLGI
jgi:hypothetical protein